MTIRPLALVTAALTFGAVAGVAGTANAASSDGAYVNNSSGCLTGADLTSCWQYHFNRNEVNTPSGVSRSGGGGTSTDTYTSVTDGTRSTRSSGGSSVMSNSAGQFVVTVHGSTTTRFDTGATSFCRDLTYWHIAQGVEQQVRGSTTSCH